MVISSRTPEGSPNSCPVCGNTVRIEPSIFGEAPCPCCGHLLWFFVLRGEPVFFLSEESMELREQVLARICENLGVNRDALLSDPSLRSELGIDSLDLVELVMELEEEFG
jgi:acyl carrier protein